MTDTFEANRKIKVLIADDDPNVVQFLADRCTRMGFEVRIATNGVQAAIMARQCPLTRQPRSRRLDNARLAGCSQATTASRCRVNAKV